MVIKYRIVSTWMEIERSRKVFGTERDTNFHDRFSRNTHAKKFTVTFALSLVVHVIGKAHSNKVQTETPFHNVSDNIVDNNYIQISHMYMMSLIE